MAQISKIKLPNNIAYDITDVSAVHSTDKGVANGVAPLNASRLIDSVYLPSYVDDVIEGYYYNNKFWKEAAHTTEISGETGKIYIDLTVNPASTYRYTGSSFVKIGGDGSVITITRNLTSGTKSATINIDGTDYDLYSTDNTTYGAGTGLSLTNNSFSVKLGYTTSGNNRAVQADGNGNLYVVQKDDNNTYSAGSGLSLSGNTFNHSNSITAQTTQAVYPIKIDAQGHVSAYGSAVTSTKSATIGITASTTATKTTLGTAFTIPNVTSAGSASTWAFEDITCDDITSWSAGSGSASISGAIDGTDSSQLNITISHTHTAPTLNYTARTVSSKKSGANSTAPTLGTAFTVPNVTGNTSATVSITDGGHTHTI